MNHPSVHRPLTAVLITEYRRPVLQATVQSGQRVHRQAAVALRPTVRHTGRARAITGVPAQERIHLLKTIQEAIQPLLRGTAVLAVTGAVLRRADMVEVQAAPLWVQAAVQAVHPLPAADSIKRINTNINQKNSLP